MFERPRALEFLLFFLICFVCNMFFNYYFTEVAPIFRNPKYPKFIQQFGPTLVAAVVGLALISALRITV